MLVNDTLYKNLTKEKIDAFVDMVQRSPGRGPVPSPSGRGLG
jgi:hypothetical protein